MQQYVDIRRSPIIAANDDLWDFAGLGSNVMILLEPKKTLLLHSQEGVRRRKLVKANFRFR